MVTLHPLFQMNAFAETYGLKDLPNVVLWQRHSFLLPSFYGIHSLPNMAFYGKNGTLIRSVEGALPGEKVLQLFKAADNRQQHNPFFYALSFRLAERHGVLKK
jgi:hypothetical protein